MASAGSQPKWLAFLVVAVIAMVLGAGGAYVVLERRAARTPEAVSTTTGSAQTPLAPGAPSAERSMQPTATPDVEVTLTEDAVARAGITTTPVTASRGSSSIRVPGVVQPNAYRSIVVTPLAAGRVTRVMAELGQSVRRGQVLAEVYSPEISEAETRFLSVRAELAAHEQILRRTEKLAEIGAASRQELERIHAEHAAATATVESARAKLRLFGLSDDEINQLSPSSELSATLRVTAPFDGVITARDANAGLNVEPTTALFTIVDRSTVWVVGDLYERDFGAVRLGSAATVTTAAYPDLKLQAKVSYIDPQVKTETRTAQLRIEVPNASGQLRFGMFADIQIVTSGSGTTITVPKSAVQMVGDRPVVYLAKAGVPGTFIEREVRLGDQRGDVVEVLSGLQSGDAVVSIGSFAVRSERERLGLRTSTTESPRKSATTPAGQPRDTAKAGPQAATIEVKDEGFSPTRVAFQPNTPARLTLIRRSDKTCGTEIVIPSLNIRRPLPLNEAVNIDFTPAKGEVAFQCGLGMLKGTIVVQ